MMLIFISGTYVATQYRTFLLRSIYYVCNIVLMPATGNSSSLFLLPAAPAFLHSSAVRNALCAHVKTIQRLFQKVRTGYWAKTYLSPFAFIGFAFTRERGPVGLLYGKKCMTICRM